MRRRSLLSIVSCAIPMATLLPLSRRLNAASSVSVSTFAGTGVAGYQLEEGQGILASRSEVNNPYGVVVGPDEALYFCEVDEGRTRRIDLASGLMTTFAGDGQALYRGDGVTARNASFSAPHEIRFDSAGNLFVVERDAHVVRRIDAQTKLVSTVAGTGVRGFSGDGGLAVEARLSSPHSIAFDASGRLLICDIGNGRVRSVDMHSGLITTLSGTGERAPTPDTGPLEGTPLRGPRSLDTDDQGNAYLVLREGNAVYQMNLEAQSLRRIAGTGNRGYEGDGGPALDANFNGPKGIAYSRQDHSLYIVDTENHAIRRLDLASGVVDTVLGTGRRGDGPDGDPLSCSLNRPHGVFVHRGLVYVTDSESHRIRLISGLMD